MIILLLIKSIYWSFLIVSFQYSIFSVLKKYTQFPFTSSLNLILTTIVFFILNRYCRLYIELILSFLYWIDIVVLNFFFSTVTDVKKTLRLKRSCYIYISSDSTSSKSQREFKETQRCLRSEQYGVSPVRLWRVLCSMAHV